MKQHKKIIREELSGFHAKLFFVKLILAFLPKYVGSRLRVQLLRLAGFNIGWGTIISGTPLIIGDEDIYKNFSIGMHCYINIGCHFNVIAPLTIGDHVSIGQNVLIITHSHNLGTTVHRAGELKKSPVKIGSGTWLGARSIILPGVTIGEGVIVAAGAVVTKDVPDNVVVAGVPAKIIRTIEPVLKQTPFVG